MGASGWQALRAALDSSPLLGASRVEDTWNLIGRAMRTVVTCAARTLGLTREAVLTAADLPLLRAPSLKAALDIDWQDPAAQATTLAQLLAEVDRLEAWVAAHVPVTEAPTVQAALTTLRRVLTQDLEPDPTTGTPRIRRGVAADRQPSIGDPAMRHGRKTKTRPFTGFKRHVLTWIDADLIVDAVVRPANEPEHATLATVTPALAAHGRLGELFIDRGYLASPTVPALAAAGVTIRAKAWTSTNRGRFPKQAFHIDLPRAQVTCPAGQHVAIAVVASAVPFPAATCQPCAQRAACTTSRRGRSVTLHPQEPLLQHLRAVQQQPDGRAILRTRVHVEHTLARIQALQGGRARYKGRARTPSTSDAPPLSPTSSGSRDYRWPRNYMLSALA